MKFETWYLALGGLLIFAALSAVFIKRLPLTTTMFYLGCGVALGPLGLGAASMHPLLEKELLERAAEMVVIVSLFTAGLKLRSPFRAGHWRVPVRLAFLSMTLTVAMVTLVGVYGFGLPVGAAVLLGAVLAPTDPVLASDVQMENADDRDKLRFSLTGEAGLNDGTAFPFLMLGLGLLGLHEVGDFGWRWWAVDVLWAIAGGLAIGAVMASLLGRLLIYLRDKHKATLGREEFLTLGLIGVTYGTALLAHTYGFLAVFAAGVSLRGIERKAVAVDDDAAHEPAREQLSESVLGFNEQLERILEVVLVLVIGLMLTPTFLDWRHVWFVPVLLLVIRPLAVWLGLIGLRTPSPQLPLISWFGIRGIGSIYYLAYGLGFGVPTELARELVSITLWVIATSIVVHGISVTPLMNFYQSTRRRRNDMPKAET